MVSALCHISDNFSQQSPAEQHTGPGPHKNISITHFLVTLAAAMGRSLQRVGGTLQTVGTGLTPLTHSRQYMCHHSNYGLQPLSTILWLPATSLPGCTAALLHTATTFRILNSGESSAPGSRLQAALALHSAQRTSQHRAVAKINSNKFNI